MTIRYRCNGGVIAWNINGTISNDREKLKAALELDLPVTLVTDAEAKFMAACDLGHKWKELAELPVLFQTTDINNAPKPTHQTREIENE